MKKLFSILALLLTMTQGAWAQNQLPQGQLVSLDGHNGSIYLAGWAYDPDVQSLPINVDYYIYTQSGNPDDSSVKNGRLAANRSNTHGWYSASGDHEFEANIDVSNLTPGTFFVCVFALDSDGGPSPKIPGRGEASEVYEFTVTFSAPYSVTYNANGGSGAPLEQKKCYNIDLTLSTAEPTRDGYTFAGWNTASDGSGADYATGATYTANADLTLYAQWTPKSDVTWDATDAEKNNWTIDPVNPVAAGAAVTATYGGLRHVKSVTYRPVPTIGGKFTINVSGDKVYFAKGNLRYVSGAWSFFDHQYDYYSSYSADAWDKFCWVGASGNLASETPGKWGVNTSVKQADYGTVVNEDLASDWGNVPGIGTGWRTLSWDEWDYLLSTRTVNGGRGAGYSYTLDQSVNDTPGSVLYPDDYTGAPYTTGANWAAFEAAGCVFLPAAGWRHSTSVDVIGTDGRYWSSTASSPEGYACCLSLKSDGYSKAVCARYYGSCIRLVFPAE